MDGMSWRAQLAKSNINILNIEWSDDQSLAEVYFEFMYHPYGGQTKWCKTWTQVAGKCLDDEDGRTIEYPVSGKDIAKQLRQDTLSLRKELEEN